MHGHRQPPPELGEADEDEAHALLGIHGEVGQQAEVLEDVVAQVVGLVDDEDGELPGLRREAGDLGPDRVMGRGAGALDAEPELLLDVRADDRAHRPGRVVGLQRDQALGDLGRQPPGLPAVGARLGVESLEAAVAVVPDPVPHGIGGDTGPVGSGDGIELAGLLAKLVADALRAQRQMHQIGDHAVSEERDRLAKVVVRVVHGAVLVDGALRPRDHDATPRPGVDQAPSSVGSPACDPSRRFRGAGSPKARAASVVARRPGRAAPSTRCCF